MFGWLSGEAPAPVFIDGLPLGAPGVEIELERIKEDCRAKLKAEDWIKVELDEEQTGANTFLWYKEQGELLSYKLEAVVEKCSPKEMKEIFWNKDLNDRKKWDTIISSFDLISTISENCEIMKSTYSPGVPLVSDRVFVVARTFWAVEKGLHYVGSSVNCDKAVQVRTRGRIVLILTSKISPLLLFVGSRQCFSSGFNRTTGACKSHSS
jgi:hypothetical protein